MDRITIAHGSGGRESAQLIKEIFYKYFNNEILLEENDSSILSFIDGEMAVTTDSFVINPLFFPGGDIGKLSICGTVNDLAVSGAKPLYVTVAFIIEEGFEIESLKKIVKSMADTAKLAGVKIVAGDTKVVEKGKADGVYINTTGIGTFGKGRRILKRNAIKVGDKVIVSGSLGDHGMCIMGQREFLGVLGDIKSDCQPLNEIIDEVLEVSKNVRVMRDPTRGGAAATFNELIQDTGLSMLLDEIKIPIKDEVLGFCEILGMEPLQIANEGKFICIVSKEDAEAVLKAMKNHSEGMDAAIIGEIVEEPRERVFLRTALGATRVIKMTEGEGLPRIC